jgi:hypothetical protein
MGLSSNTRRHCGRIGGEAVHEITQLARKAMTLRKLV